MREEWPCVTPASHLSHVHWNNITDTYAVPAGVLKNWIDDSYRIVAAGLTRKLKEELKKQSTYGSTPEGI